ncbi:isochorismatase family protein [Baekduia soli]|uniref:Isochorismatase family protein n=1 Tax=Baekduia soli TaxID=496014 RepID=A0A5B8U3J7_9ACTN|nr:isochorismatase family protein [Baekduia soli]QEC47560.1 isochorismatase family protein [Baekduia soli]
MSGPAPWEGVVGPGDEARYRAAGFGGPSGSGSRPALLVIDVQYRTTGSRPMPFDEAVQEYSTSCGDVAWAALEHIERLVTGFRALDLPVLYPHVAPKLGYDAGRLAAKVPAIMDVPDRGYDFVEAVAPRPGDILVPKRHPSAFFATSLTSYLVDLGVDWLVVCGCTTSGCVRASVVDGFSYNFRATVPHDAVYDRSQAVHAVNLFDMAQKYADVVSTDAVLEAVAAARA